MKYILITLFTLLLCINCVHQGIKPIVYDLNQDTKDTCRKVIPDINLVYNYLDSVDLDTLATGKYIIKGDDVYMILMEGDLKSKEDAFLEIHNIYYDMHIPISGEESYGYRAKDKLQTPRGEMDIENDIQFFEDKFDEIIHLRPKQFLIFTPECAHAPMIGNGSIKKAIIKIKKSHNNISQSYSGD